jgi:hypothetical protein
MPYISESERKRYEGVLAELDKIPVNTPGKLNYLITEIIKRYINNHDHYATYNAAIGALECAKLELYRRLVSPYEDKKIDENGDVY